MMISLRAFAAISATLVWVETCSADCSSLYALAQQHANDMARRNSLDHAGFMQHRGPAGAVAENVAMGCATEACARRMWMQAGKSCLAAGKCCLGIVTTTTQQAGAGGVITCVQIKDKVSIQVSAITRSVA